MKRPRAEKGRMKTMRSGTIRSKAQRWWPVAVLGVLAPAVGLAFTPTVNQSLNSKYPPIFRADLSGCERGLGAAPAAATVDEQKLLRRLLGTWGLQSRTRAGMKAPVDTQTTTLYFDLEPLYGRAAGAALRTRAAAGPVGVWTGRPADGNTERPDAFWQVAIARPQRERVALTMTGRAVREGGAVLPDVHQLSFAQAGGVFAAVPARGSAWDKVVLTHDTLTFVRCRDGLVERYAKTAAGTPTIAGATLESYWRQFEWGGSPAGQPRTPAGVLGGQGGNRP